MKPVNKNVLKIADILAAPVVYPAAWLLRTLREAGVHRMPRCRRALMKIGVFPIRNHYYEPLFDGSSLRHPLDEVRNLPGIDWNVDGQLTLLDAFRFSDELKDVPTGEAGEGTFSFGNDSFKSGDAEFLYNLIRLKKPSRILEIGSGNSTLMAKRATDKNREEDAGYVCRHVCIEPYEAPWLEKTGLTVVRQCLEDVDRALFSELGRGDILFIDSSHMIRPQGDVLIEYLELLPSLAPGVIVHVHDIFSPRDYLKEWILDEVWFWNEQYLFEAFLTNNRDWKIIGALNYLKHDHFDKLRAACPFLTSDREPGSFYIEKVG